ncbi:DUF5715 family protein [Actinocatenispora sera]|uniref:DUF5715 family protein n=1 Tax=Actinocatenispora sera TaxID=390989 RepID=UPI0033C0527E
MGSPKQDLRPAPGLRPARRRRRAAPPVPGPDVPAYRSAVADLLAELTRDPARTPAILTRRLAEPVYAGLLAATPRGRTAVLGDLLRAVQAVLRRPGGEPVPLVRVQLLAQIDALWWGRSPAYPSGAELCAAADLVDLEPLRRAGRLGFRYRRQPTHLVGRAIRSAHRRAVQRGLWPERSPRTAGLRYPRTRPEAVALLNQVARRFAERAPAGTPPLWVTSLARSTRHQDRLTRLGYPTMPASAHCSGYAVDVELAWYARYGARHVLAAELLARQDAGQVNVIDEGQVWHVCLSPAALPALRRDFDAALGG